MHSIKSLQLNTRRKVFCVAFFMPISIFFLVLTHTVFASELSFKDQNYQWQKVESEGRNQSVYFHAWGGDPQINAYIQWVGQQVKNQYNINLRHVKLSDTSEAVSRVLAEKSANNNTQGNVDLVWINGANFATMAEHSLLLKGWVGQLPNFKYTDPDNNPAVILDFGVPTEGMEAPWGQSSLTFYYDQLATLKPPQNLKQLLIWAKANPGRFGYPKPTDFLGMSFLKYILAVLHQNNSATLLSAEEHQATKALLYAKATGQHTEQVLKPLWDYLNELHPHLWRKGEHFMQSGVEMSRLVDDTELSLAFTFAAPQVPAAVKRFDLPKSIRSYAMADGSLSNTHFVGLPYNATNQQGAQLVANFLLSPKAQAYKQQTNIWGDRTVLIASTLNSEQQALFKGQTPHPSALPFNSIIHTLSEPHPSWVAEILKGWEKRFGVTQWQ